jgi:hypothetical protein
MTNITVRTNLSALAVASPLPPPRFELQVRSAVPADLPFIDQLQKMHGHAVGWAPTKQLETNIANGEMLIADSFGCPMGYLLAKDRYKGNDACGIVYQLNVVPVKHRQLVGANLVQAFIERAPVGMRLLCCWCAQDLPANRFWEAIGCVPLAFRTGSRGKQRIHIFWQKRTRSGDQTTPWWYPSTTTGGAVREDRIILPMLPGMHWSDAKPIVLPGMDQTAIQANGLPAPVQRKALPPAAPKPVPTVKELTEAAKRKSPHLKYFPKGVLRVMTSSGIKAIATDEYQPETEVKRERKAPTPRQKNSREHAQQARDLRDRFIEEIAPQIQPACTKWDVSRVLPPIESLHLGTVGMGGSRGLLPQAEPPIIASDS